MMPAFELRSFGKDGQVLNHLRGVSLDPREMEDLVLCQQNDNETVRVLVTVADQFVDIALPGPEKRTNYVPPRPFMTTTFREVVSA